eukprot:86765-Prorocentrum_lima.AAC.1
MEWKLSGALRRWPLQEAGQACMHGGHGEGRGHGWMRDGETGEKKGGGGRGKRSPQDDDTIRPIARHDAPSAPGVGTGAVELDGRGVRAVGGGVDNICLLYTSDAADDM